MERLKNEISGREIDKRKDTKHQISQIQWT